MKIIFTLKDKETLKEYQNVHPDLVLEDFIENFEGWKNLGIFKVLKVQPNKHSTKSHH
jgi:hypothetical protein